MLVGTLYFGYASVWSYLQQSIAHSSYVPIQAVVVEASVRPRGSSSTTHGESFHPHIVYRYSIAGREYESTRYFFAGNRSFDRSSAEAAIAGLSAGSAVQAYVDPDNPSRAVLDRGRPHPGMLLFLLPLALASIAAIAYGLRNPRKT